VRAERFRGSDYRRYLAGIATELLFVIVLFAAGFLLIAAIDWVFIRWLT
jgi:hypothetical protein